MKTTIFEIKVAIIGYVSVGKTTVLNALFREKFGEVSMRRTTAAVNFFRIESAGRDSANSTLAQTIEDNLAFRNEDVVCERSFQVALEDPLHTMRDDTSLVIVDVPGVNEARASSKYANYLSDNWHTFDCIVLVVDGKQGANTEEQLRLLKMIRTHSVKRDVPIIVLCNKVDDPDDEEQKLLVEETRAEVERIFRSARKTSVAGRFKSSVQSLFGSESIHNTSEKTKESQPDFIPISAIHAFMYRSLSHMPFHRFKKVEPEIIDKLGRENYGTQWKRWDAKEKIVKAYEIIGDESRCREGLLSSNFDEFLCTLRNCIGNEENQKSIIEQQLAIQADILSQNPWNADILQEIRTIHERFCAIDRPSTTLSALFWKVYDKIENHAFNCVKEPDSISCLALPMDLLDNYLKFVQTTAGWKEEEEVVLARARQLVYRQAGLLMDEQVWMQWRLSSFDRSLIFGSFLLMSRDHEFCDQFGRLLLVLEQLHHESLTCLNAERTEKCPGCTWSLSVRDGVSFCQRCKKYTVPHQKLECPFCAKRLEVSYATNTPQIRCSDCWKSFLSLPMDDYSLAYKDGELKPAHEAFYNRNVRVSVPDSISDPRHFGHLSWRCCHLFRLVRGDENDFLRDFHTSGRIFCFG